MRISFGPFAFDRQSRLLWREGTEIALPPRVLGVLELLIDRAGQVVARQDLLDGVWKDAFVTDTSLAEAVSYLRQALGDDPQSPRYIQTVHRRGYRFLAPVVHDVPATAVVTLTPPGGVSVATPEGEAAKASLYWQLVPLWAALLSGAMLWIAVWRTGPQGDAAAQPVIRFQIQTAPGTAFDPSAPAVAIAADGRSIAWAACVQASRACALYLRALDRLDSTRLAATDGASAPFFSPDGRWIGFFADGKLKKIAAAGGSPSTLADAPAPGGGAWGANGQIAFAGMPAGGLSLVSENGGEVTTLTTPRVDRGEVRHMHPAWLPSGAVIFVVKSTTLLDSRGDLAVIRRDARDWSILRGGVSRAALAGPAYLLLGNGLDLQAATFDERSLTLTGGSDSVLANGAGADAVAHFATGGGALVMVPAAEPARLLWSDGQDASAMAGWSSIAISPDGRRAAGVVADAAGSNIWLSELATGAVTRLTYAGVNVSPAWSADGSRVFFATRSSGAFSLASRRVDDPAVTALAITGAANLFPSSVAADGRIAVTTTGNGGHTAVAIVPAARGALQLQPSGPFDESAAAFSPDGRWLALQSSESGRAEIVVRDLRDGRRIPVSTGGGTNPRWSGDGRAIFFDRAGDVVRVAFDGTAAMPRPEVVHEQGRGRVIAIAPGGRLLVEQPSHLPDRAVVILQWLQELRQRLPLPVRTPR